MDGSRSIWGSRFKVLGILMAVVFAAVLLANAWVVDDAYITFRTVSQFVSGNGLIWNPGERVQAYTHPLWMFLISFFYFFTSELFFTSIAISFITSLLAVGVAGRSLCNSENLAWKQGLLLLALLASKAFVDYTSSGLENPLSYLLYACFFSLAMRDSSEDPTTYRRRFFLLILIAALAFVNRQDTVIIYCPSLLFQLFYRYRSMPKKELVTLLFVGTLPATSWLLFSLIYYGFPLPNTAYAKSLALGVPWAWKLKVAVEYFTYGLSWDFPSFLMIGLACTLALKRRSFEIVMLLVGVVLYLIFVAISGAPATHMAGRFFALPFFAGIVAFVYLLTSARIGVVVAAALLLFMATSPVSSVKFGTDAYKFSQLNMDYIDTKYYVFNEGAALLNWRPGKAMPQHAWYLEGLRLKDSPQKILVGGANGGPAIGYFAFAAGNDKFIVDYLGLSDPLLARLPVTPLFGNRPGHYSRTVPQGYLETIASGNNQIVDDGIHQYYDKIHTIVSGPVFSWERFKVIVNMNLGRYQYLLANLN